MGGTAQSFAANVDAAEGRLTAKQKDEVYSAVTKQRGEATGDAALLLEGNRVTDVDVERSQHIGWMLLVAAAALMAVEVLLARRVTVEE